MSRRISSPVFVGRRQELGRLAELRARVSASGPGETILVTGEAGVGKTRFLREVMGQARNDGWLVLSGACDEFGATARPLSALAEMVPALGRFLGNEAPGERERPAWLALEALSAGVAAPSDTGSVVQLAQDLFRRVAAIRPLMVVVDDLHWADESTRGLFGTLARGLADCPAMLVGAYRGDEVDRAHPLHAVLSAVHRNGTPEVVELSPLARDEAELLAQAVGGGTSPVGFEQLFERSEGNAFFLEELLATPAGTVPQGVRETVFARLSGLGRDALAVAEVASLDTVVPGEVLASVSGLEAGPFATALDSLTDSGMLVAAAEGYAFRHALMREAVYDQISPRRRAELHGRVAQALENTGRAQASAIAAHWRRSGEKGKALVSAVDAGRHSFEIGAMPESADWYEAALELWEDVAHPEALLGLPRATLVMEAGDSLSACRRWWRAVEVTRSAFINTESLSSVDTVELWMRLARFSFEDVGHEAIAMPLAEQAILNAREALREEMPALDKIRLLGRWAGNVIVTRGLEVEAAEAFDEVTELVEQEGAFDHPTFVAVGLHLQASTGSEEIFEALARDPDLPISTIPFFRYEVDGVYLSCLRWAFMTCAWNGASSALTSSTPREGPRMLSRLSGP